MPPQLQSRFVSNGSVRLHYVAGGEGAPVLFLHGLPDFWNGWRHQLDFFAGRHRVAAMDLRGVNESGKPEGIERYRMHELVGDALAVMHDLGGERVTLVGHDWGGMIAWWTAILFPQRVARLAVLSAPHPLCYLAAVADGSQRPFMRYMEALVNAPPGAPLDIAAMSEWVEEPTARAELAAALARSSADGIRNYYRANLASQAVPDPAAVAPVAVPALVMYGETDPVITPRAYDNTAAYVRAPLHVVRLPCGHFPHHQAAARVNAELARWLAPDLHPPLEGEGRC